MGHWFHAECLVCVHCEAAVKPADLIPLYGFPYCAACYKRVEPWLPKCCVCGESINPSLEMRDFFFRGKKYFVHFPECFKCTYCPNQLNLKDCCVCDGKLLCRDCLNLGYERTCAGCNLPIFTDKCRVENMWWHPEHFVCWRCKKKLKPNTCVFTHGVLLCRTCATTEGQKCKGCRKPLKDEGVRACGGLWHESCVKCQFCSKTLLHKKFANVQFKPSCLKCFRRLKKTKQIDKWGQLIDNSDAGV